MDNFTFAPGDIDDDQTKCLSLMLRSVKRFRFTFSFYLTLSRSELVVSFVMLSL